MNIVLEYEMNFPFILIFRRDVILYSYAIPSSLDSHSLREGMIYFSDLASVLLVSFFIVKTSERTKSPAGDYRRDYVAFLHVL